LNIKVAAPLTGIKHKLAQKLPTQAALEQNRWLRPILSKVKGRTYLWEFGATGVIRATMIGVFWAMMPIPMQMLPATLCAIWLRANLIATLAWVWLNNPFTLVPILYASYLIGCHLLGHTISVPHGALNSFFTWSNLKAIATPLGCGALILGIISSASISSVVAVIYRLRRSN
jgi:hypothetical protein